MLFHYGLGGVAPGSSGAVAIVDGLDPSVFTLD